MRLSRPGLVGAVAMSMVVVAAACGSSDDETTPASSTAPSQAAAAPAATSPAGGPQADAGTAELSAALGMELQNVVTGETFKLADFSGQVVVLEAMAVWCPICLQQQRELVKAKAQVGDDVRFVSVDLGPNENKTILKRHVEGHGFDWAFAVPNRTFTRALANDTSRLILDPTIAPVIIIDKDGGLHLIGSRRVKSAGDLVNEIAKYQG